MLVKNLDEIHPSDCPILAQVRKKYANWRCNYSYGYIRYTRGNTHRLEHRLVTNAPRGMHVHHIDGDITNNAASNLQVMTPSEHATLHKGNRVELTCPICGANFDRKGSELAEKNYCSKRCASRATRRARRPSAHELQKLLADVGNWCAVGRMFGVSDNAVRKWAKYYGLNMAGIDGRVKSTPGPI